MPEQDENARLPRTPLVSRRAVLGGLAAASVTPWLLAKVQPAEAQAAGTSPTDFIARQQHIAVPLGGGNILVAGGLSADGTPLSDVVYYTSSGVVYALAPLNMARYAAAGVLITYGKVLILGGTQDGSTALTECEVYDPINNVWTQAADLQTARFNHMAARTVSNQVLITGGYDGATVLYDSETYLF